MTDYTAPVRDMRFVIEELVGLDTVTGLPGCDGVSDDLVGAVLEEAGRLASEVMAPLNRVGDVEGSRLENGVVSTPKGFAEAYRAFTEGGWNSVPFAEEFGGQGLPWLVATPVAEIWASANLALSLCPVLTQAGVALLIAHGSAEQQQTWLPKLVSGEWTGTMVMTEPHAGSDVGKLRTRAVRDGESYRLTGQKIFISWGEHDMTDNIVHMVLARAEGAPPGVKGLSLFIVPKFLVNPDGSLGPRNDVRCAALEHKLGIMASPTGVMAFGDNDGAVGYLIGEENRGLEYMFTMMNNVRFAVGVEGVAIAERAYQQARDYAMTRVQGHDIDDPAAGDVTILRHPDVRRMLMTMKAQTEAARALAYSVAASLDIATRHDDESVRRRHRARVGLLIPVVKAWSTDIGVETASLGIQVHGGAGFIEETGAAQHYRDARIPPIYEGTNGIQALDLARRKIARDGGAEAAGMIAEIKALDGALAAAKGPAMPVIRAALADATAALERATEWMVGAGARDAAAGATPYLRLFGTVIGGYLLARSAVLADQRLAEANGDAAFYEAKLATARFYAENILPQAAGLERMASAGADAVMALSDEQF